MKAIAAALLSLVWTAVSFAAEPPKAVDRTIIAIFDSRGGETLQYSRIHRLAEMPLNHLGLKLRYFDINKPLPDPDTLEGVRGVLTWFESDDMPDPNGYIDWAIRMMDRGARYVVMGNPAITKDLDGRATSITRMNKFLERIGMISERDWLNLTYDVKLVHLDRRMIGFERPLRGVLPPYEPIKMIDPQGTSHLIARRRGDPRTDSDLIAVTRRGGYVAAGYAVYRDPVFDQTFWHLNPFEFFRRTFATDDIPKPDPTTLGGFRIYYSHVDGDGWRNISEIRKYRKKKIMSSEVILKEVLQRFPDLPVTIGPVTAELDLRWQGTEETRRIAKEIFELPHIEAGSHTHSHPFFWRFYDKYSRAKEQPFLKKYPYANRDIRRRYDNAGGLTKNSKAELEYMKRLDYTMPRAFLDYPFKVGLEIGGSIAIVESLLPKGKRVEVFQWSGDTTPSAPFLAAVRVVGIPNINGGDSRFDREYPSHTSVAPIGRQVGAERQIYASNSNENTYTDLWQGRYFGFLHLVRTIKNTEIPIRLKPINVYYHMYSGQKLSSLNALLRNLAYARKQEIIPIPTSQYARIAGGFYTARFIPLGERSWRIENRGRLQTIRFDNATFKAVDLAKSRGVIGQRHLQGSLYIALDRAVASPVVTLKSVVESDREPEAATPYLVGSRWQVEDVETHETGFEFRTTGFGAGWMQWRIPWQGPVRVVLSRDGRKLQNFEATPSKQGVVTLELGRDGIKPMTVSVTRGDNS